MDDVKIKNLMVGGILSTIAISLYGFVACKIGFELGEPAMAGCRAINLMLSLPSGTFVVLAIVLIGMIIKSVRNRGRTTMV
jgi:hypothetical protein